MNNFQFSIFNIQSKRGFTLIETLFYIVGLLVLLAAMTGFMYYMYDWYQRTTISPRIDRIGVSMVDKIAKDLRSGTSINVAQSSFGINNGVLDFNYYFSTSQLYIKHIALEGNRITYKDGPSATAFLSPSNVYVTRFLVVSTSTPVSKGIKFDIDITYVLRSTGSTTKTYSGFAILRQSY
jgi:type II secretory pathway pseudopilin PulG